MKTLLVILLTFVSLAALSITSQPITAQCDPDTDPSCHIMCPRDGECVCTWEPNCTPMPTKAGKPTSTPVITGTPKQHEPYVVQSVRIESDLRGWCHVEIWGNGHWWRVTDDAHPDGIQVYSDGRAELIASDPDPTHYRLIDCNAP